MIFAFVGYVFGSDGVFKFEEIGLSYSDVANVPYVQMRLVSAICGSLLAPISYLMLMEMGLSEISAVLASCMIIFGKTCILVKLMSRQFFTSNIKNNRA